jgi:hypothetical protein
VPGQLLNASNQQQIKVAERAEECEAFHFRAQALHTRAHHHSAEANFRRENRADAPAARLDKLAFSGPPNFVIRGGTSLRDLEFST